MRKFRITSEDVGLNNLKFVVSDEAEEEEIADVAWDIVTEYIDFGWEEVFEGDKNESAESPPVQET